MGRAIGDHDPHAGTQPPRPRRLLRPIPAPSECRWRCSRSSRPKLCASSAATAKRHKIVLLDEAWFLLASTQGRPLLNRLVRLGRSMNTTILLATQRLADLGDLSELVGVYLLFGQDSLAEAERALAMVDLDPEDAALRQRLTEYRQGLCLVRDLDGRVGEVQSTPSFPSWWRRSDDAEGGAL